MNALTRPGPRTASIGSFTGLLTPVVINGPTAGAPMPSATHAETTIHAQGPAGPVHPPMRVARPDARSGLELTDGGPDHGETVPAECEDPSFAVSREDAGPVELGADAGRAAPREDAGPIGLSEDPSSAVPREDAGPVEPPARRGRPRARSWLPWRRSSRIGEEGEAPDPEQLVTAVEARSSRGRHRLTGRSAPIKPVEPVEPVEPVQPVEPAPGLGSEREPSRSAVTTAQPADASGHADDKSIGPAAPSRYAVLNNARVVWTAGGSDLP